MAYTPLKKLSYPQLWRKVQSNSLVEVVIIENFGKGPQWFRLWVPNTRPVAEAVKKRMAVDHQIDFDDYTVLHCNDSPLPAFLSK